MSKRKITESEDGFKITFEVSGSFDPSGKAYRNMMKRMLGRIQAEQEQPSKKKGVKGLDVGKGAKAQPAEVRSSRTASTKRRKV